MRSVQEGKRKPLLEVEINPLLFFSRQKTARCEGTIQDGPREQGRAVCKTQTPLQVHTVPAGLDVPRKKLLF